MNTEKKTGQAKWSFAGLYMRYGMFLILIILAIAASIISPAFLSVINITNIVKYISIVAVVAFGETLILILGEIDLSLGSVMALSGCVCCRLIVSSGSLVVGLLGGIAIGLLCGAVNGLVISAFHIPSFIITLATMKIARGAVLLFTNAVPVSGMGDAFGFIGQGYIFGKVPMTVIVMACVFVLTWFILNRHQFGRHIYACGGNVMAARASGIKTGKTVTITYTIMGILSAVAGIVLMSYMNSGQPAGADGYEMDAITAAIVGGTSFTGGIGTIQGTFIGCLIVGILDNVMNLMSVSSYWQQIVRGIIIALAVIMDVVSKSAIKGKE